MTANCGEILNLADRWRLTVKIDPDDDKFVVTVPDLTDFIPVIRTDTYAQAMDISRAIGRAYTWGYRWGREVEAKAK